MEIFDISVPIRTGMVTYPGDPQVRLERVASIADGAAANVSKLDLGVHSGTHVDAPVHFIEGAAGTEELLLDVLLGPCVVVAAGDEAPEHDGKCNGLDPFSHSTEPIAAGSSMK